MCGIAAIFAYHPDAPAVDEGELTAIRDRMTARGPDGFGNWFDDRRRVGLGHRRLSILDLSDAGAQPMGLASPSHQPSTPGRADASRNRINSQPQYWITFNGEIYNFRALRSELEANGHRFLSGSDTEVLLHLYAEHGERMVDHLRGMYAFAIWDEARRGLFLARDPFGIKPLYLADDGRTLRVASQVKALLAGRHVDTTPDAPGHAGFFLWGHVPDPFTLYRGIRALPAGHSLWLPENGARQQKCFCSISEILRSAESSPLRRGRGEGQGEVSNSGDSALPARFSTSNPLSRRSGAETDPLSALLKDSISHHLIADVPVGVFLSSGLDSTTLAALAAEQGGRLRTVTLGFEEFRGTPDDEVPLAELVARQLGADHQTVWVQRADFERETENLFSAMDQPSTDGVNTYFVSLAARRAGLKVALSGLGGDELFGGYPSFAQIPRSARLLGRLDGLPMLGRAFRRVSSPILRRLTSPKYAGLFEFGGRYAGAYLLRRGMFMPWEMPRDIDPEWLGAGLEQLATVPALTETVTGLRSPHARVAALEMQWYMRHQLLRDSDWAGMAHSLEIRVPLVDVTLLRSLAPAIGSPNPPTKRDMAAAPGTPLPAAVLVRKKTGFQVPVRDWLLAASRPRSGSGMKGEVSNPQPSTLNPQPASPLVGRDHPSAPPPPQPSTINSQPSPSPQPSPPPVGRARPCAPAIPPTALNSKPRSERGLRGWAREVHSRFAGPVSAFNFHVSGLPRSRRLREPDNSLPAPQRILVFRIGQLGDTIIALPAMWAVRRHFPQANLTLLCDRHSAKSYVLAADLLHEVGIFDAFESYLVDDSSLGRLAMPWRMLKLLRRLRRLQFDALVYLAPSNRNPAQVERDHRFFAAAGVTQFYGLDGFRNFPAPQPGTPLPELPSEADMLMDRLAADGLPRVPSSLNPLELNLGPRDESQVNDWLRSLPADGGRTWLAVGPGSKMPSKRWPESRFREVVAQLIAQCDVWPVIFGGPEDKRCGDQLLSAWARGYNAAGALGLRSAAAALQRCSLYLGNDTGTMHLAAAVRVPCVAIFSARSHPGVWYPYGVRSRVLRAEIDCEGCGLVECAARRNECLERITVAEVLTACQTLLSAPLMTHA